MKNRMYEPKEKNGKFFCWHNWEAVDYPAYGPDWDLLAGLKVPAVCSKCGKCKDVSNLMLNEVPDSSIDKSIYYR